MRVVRLSVLVFVLAFIAGCASGPQPKVGKNETWTSLGTYGGPGGDLVTQRVNLPGDAYPAGEPDEVGRLLARLRSPESGDRGGVRLAAATGAVLDKATQERAKSTLGVTDLPSNPENVPYKVINGVAEYVIGPGDVLEIIAFRRGVAQGARVVVPPSGKISYSFVQDITVAGLTTSEVDGLITKRLAKFVRRPMIDVYVREYNSKKVSLFGEINRVQGVPLSGPAIYPLKGKTTVLDLLLIAGSATPDADLKRVELTRGGKVYLLDLERALTKGDIAQNIILETNDRIVIPKKHELLAVAKPKVKISVLGEVRSSGTYEFEPGRKDIPILEALSKAGGVTNIANIKAIRVIRKGGPKGFTVLESNLAKLRKGDVSQNIILQHGDTIFVGKSLSGKINEVVSRISPMLSFLLFPATYRDLYTTGGGLRVDTGFPPAAAGVAGGAAQQELLRRSLPTVPIAP